MRHALLLSAGWLGALQSVVGASRLEDATRLAGIAGVLGTLTVLIYRLGVWRQEMEHTKHDVAAEMKAYRAEAAESFRRLDRRREAIDHLMTAAAEQRVRAARWQSRTERRIDRLEAQQGAEHLQ